MPGYAAIDAANEEEKKGSFRLCHRFAIPVVATGNDTEGFVVFNRGT